MDVRTTLIIDEGLLRRAKNSRVSMRRPRWFGPDLKR